jgi:hypothetical protein
VADPEEAVNVLTPEVMHLLFALAGVLLGWYARRRRLRVPPDLLDALEQLAVRHKESEVLSLLRKLVEHFRTSPPGPRP